MRARLVLSVLIPFVAGAVQWLLWDYIKPYVWFFFFPAAFFSAWIGGLAGGLAGTVVGALLVWYIFIPSPFSFALETPAAAFSIVVFVFMGGCFAFFFDRLQRALRRADEALEALRQRSAELERSNRELDDFACIASHDLKEPLRGLHNYASFLQEDYAARLDDEGKRYLDRMQRLVERLTALIDRLLAYSRVGSKELPVEPVALDALLDDVVADLQPFLAEQGVGLVRATPLPTLTCNALRVGEVFQNLITNAAKYNDKPEKRVEIGCSGRGATEKPPVFYVRDNGIGIAPQHSDSVFRIFKRLHEQEKFGGGTGAGLTIAKKIVERHGGRIWLESAPGEGTTFFFTLGGHTS